MQTPFACKLVPVVGVEPTCLAAVDFDVVYIPTG